MYFSLTYFWKYYILALVHLKFYRTHLLFTVVKILVPMVFMFLCFIYNEVLKCWFKIHSSLILFHEYEENIVFSEGLCEHPIPHQAFSCLLLLIRNRIFQAKKFHCEKIKSRWPAKVENLSFNFLPKGNIFCGETKIHTWMLLSSYQGVGLWPRQSHTQSCFRVESLHQTEIFFNQNRAIVQCWMYSKEPDLLWCKCAISNPGSILLRWWTSKKKSKKIK